MSDEIIERVKRAIFVSADDAHNTWPTPDHPECVKMARAAIAAAQWWQALDAAPRDRVFLAWDGEARFLCGWAPEDGWCVMNSDALEDIADDGEGRNRTADPILWTEIPREPT